MEFETGRTPAIQITPRQRWSIAVTYLLLAVGFVMGVNQRDSALNQASIYSNLEAGFTASYPARWLLEESGAYVFRVRDMSHRGFNTVIEVSTAPVGADTSERNILDQLSLRRSQTLTDYTVLGYEPYLLPMTAGRSRCRIHSWRAIPAPSMRAYHQSSMAWIFSPSDAGKL